MVKSTVMIVTLLLLVVVGLLVPVPLRGPQAAPLADLAHAPVFAAVELLILLVWWFPLVKHCGNENARPQPIWASICSRVVPVFALLFLFGGCMEYVQAHVGRSGSWGDVLRNTLGLVAGICFLVAFIAHRRSAGRRQTLPFMIAGFSFLVAASVSPAYHLWLIYRGDFN